MRVSVIIPTFNRATTITRAIDSVYAGKFKDFELIVVDDGSTDETVDLLKRYEDLENFTLVQVANGGVSKARNIGRTYAQGEWLAFLDSDDEWLKNKLELQVSFIDQNPEIEIIHGEEIWIRNAKRVNQKKIHKKEGGDIFKRCLKLCLISPSAVIIKKELYDEMKGFSEDFVVCEDYDLWLKITSLKSVGFIETPIINKYGGHEDQLSAKFFAMDYFRIKSIANILRTRDLSGDYRSAAISELAQKSRILIQGYKKHNNLENLSEIEEILNEFSESV